jgi:hypothetical protein
MTLHSRCTRQDSIERSYFPGTFKREVNCTLISTAMSLTNTAFNFPVKRLENSLLVLEPFEADRHAELFVQGCKDYPELFDYLPYGPFASIAEFEAFYEARIAPSPTETMFAVLTKSSPSNESGTLAGVIGLLNASPSNASIEIGFVNSHTDLLSSTSPCLVLTENHRSPSCLLSKGHM